MMTVRALIAAIAVAFCLVAGASAQSAGDLVELWLAQQGKAAVQGDYSTCAPANGPDGICAWNTGKLGAQPTADQLQALVPAWQNAQEAKHYPAVVAAGLSVTSSGTPALNGTYAIDGQQQAHISAEITSILLNGTFTNGQTTRAWPDASGAMHTFTVAQFKALATAIGAYVDAVIMTYEAQRSGQAVPWPNAAAVIP